MKNQNHPDATCKQPYSKNSAKTLRSIVFDVFFVVVVVVVVVVSKCQLH